MNHLDARDDVDAACDDLCRYILRSMLDGRAERTHLVRHGLVAFHRPVERISTLPANAAVLAEALRKLVACRLRADSVSGVAPTTDMQLAQWVRVHGQALGVTGK